MRPFFPMRLVLPTRSKVMLPVAMLLLVLGFGGTLRAQLKVEPTAFSVWLDFADLSRSNHGRVALPIWMESLQTDYKPASPGKPETTAFRIRFRRNLHPHPHVQLRVFFDDIAGHEPIVTGWTETGGLRYHSRALGSGVGLPTSESLVVPVEDVDYLDITVPGNGSNVRGVFVATLRRSQQLHALDFEPLTDLADPFDNSPGVRAGEDDVYLYGRVRALLDPGPVRLDHREIAFTTIGFELEARPLLAVVTLEILNADPRRPIEARINNIPLGRVSLQVPDLADPGFVGIERPLDRDMQFHFTGWMRAQVVLPGSALEAGANTLTFHLPDDAGPVAIRSIEIQLKHYWEKLEYRLEPQ